MKSFGETPKKNSLAAFKKRMTTSVAALFGNAIPESAATPPTGEDRSRAIVESAYDAFIGMDTKGYIIDWNRQAELTFGWNRDEVLGKMLSDVVIPERYREAHRKGIEKYLATGEGPVLNKRIEVFACHRSGRQIPVELTIYPIRQGDTLQFGSFLHDITDRKRKTLIQNTQMKVTADLVESETLAQAIPKLLETMCKGIGWKVGELWLLNTQSNSLYCAGFWKNASLDTKGFEIRTANLQLQIGAGMPGRVWQTQEAFWVDDLSKEPNFPRQPEAQSAGLRSALAFPVTTSQGETFGAIAFYDTEIQESDLEILAMMKDIGNRIALFVQRKNVEQRLVELHQELESRVADRTKELAIMNSRLQEETKENQKLYEQAQLANRLKDEFLATVSHELRTPLGVIQGHSELLLEGLENPTEVRQSLETILRNAKAQGQIINDLLDVSRIITGKLQLDFAPIDLKTVINSALDSIHLSAHSKDISLHSSFEKGLGPISGDANRLQQVLWNLLSNAVKFTPKGGSIRIDLKRNQSNAQIEISDTGRGIDSEFLPHVFERFRQEDATTTRRYGGLGLGLAIVRHLIEAHGGTVNVLSAGKNQGTEFIVKLPLLAAHHKVENTKEIKSDRMTASLKDIRILVVDDEPDTRQMLSRLLTRVQGSVVCASSAQEALTQLKDFQPHILVSDISMPEEDGYQLIEKIRKLPDLHLSKIPAIALTAHARSDEKEMAIRSGFQVHITKPVEASHLVHTILEVLKQS